MFYLYLIIILISILFLIFKLYIKIKYKFWANQPVFHKYNLFNWIYKQDIINNELPKANRYCNFYNIIVTEYDERNDNTLKEIVELLQKKRNYSDNEYQLLTLSTFSSYFIGCNNKSYISTYYNNIYSDKLEEKPKMSPSAIITTRPLNITFKKTISFKLYYIDYLCVHNDNKNDGIFEEIFQTHEYIQRYKNTNIKILLFKTREKIPGVVALTRYNIYKFEIKQIPKQSLPHAAMQLIEINKLNIRLLITLIHNYREKLDCFIIPDLTNLLNLINTGVYKVYGIIEKNTLISCYFFRKSNIQDNTMEFFASISDCYYKIFIAGFSIAINKLNLLLITIENISYNNIIINYLFLLNIIPKSTNSLSYFLYNYIKTPILPEKIFILI